MKKITALLLTLVLLSGCCLAASQTMTVGLLTLVIPDTVTVVNNAMRSSDGYASMTVKQTQYPLNEYLAMYYEAGQDVTQDDIDDLAETELEYAAYYFYDDAKLTLKNLLGTALYRAEDYDLAVWQYEVVAFGGLEAYVDSVFITQIVCFNTVTHDETYEFSILGLKRESVSELESVFNLSEPASYSYADTVLPETKLDMYSFVKAYNDLIPLAFGSNAKKMLAHDMDYSWLYNYMEYGDDIDIEEHVDANYGVVFYSSAVCTSLSFGIKDTSQSALTAVIAEGEEDVNVRIRMLSAILDAYFHEGDIGDWLDEVRTTESFSTFNTAPAEYTYEGSSVRLSYRVGKISSGIVRIITVELK